jgi:arabinogalactan endo-1,4-beta-galactosidase
MWQIWNEPNIRTFWPPRPIASTYVALVAAAHKAIKRVDPNAKVVLGGMPNYSWVQLKAIYKVPGARRQFDIVAVHPYTAKPDGVITILKRVRTVMDKAGDSRKPILADEVSWPSSLGKVPSSGKFDVATTESGQARKITQLLPLLARDRRALGLLGFDYYTWASVERRPGIPFDYAGLFRFSDGSFIAKPAYYAFRKAALAMERCRQKGDVATICAEAG